MQTCKMCGARLMDDNEVSRHNETMHPNMAGKKGGRPSDGMPIDEMPGDEMPGERKPDMDRPID